MLQVYCDGMKRYLKYYAVLFGLQAIAPPKEARLFGDEDKVAALTQAAASIMESMSSKNEAAKNASQGDVKANYNDEIVESFKIMIEFAKIASIRFSIPDLAIDIERSYLLIGAFNSSISKSLLLLAPNKDALQFDGSVRDFVCGVYNFAQIFGGHFAIFNPVHYYFPSRLIFGAFNDFHALAQKMLPMFHEIAVPELIRSVALDVAKFNVKMNRALIADVIGTIDATKKLY